MLLTFLEYCGCTETSHRLHLLSYHLFAEFVYVYECDWNYRPDHCMYMSSCKIAEKNGISVIHGNRGTLHNDKQPAFKAIYDSINEVRLHCDCATKLLSLRRIYAQNSWWIWELLDRCLGMLEIV